MNPLCEAFNLARDLLAAGRHAELAGVVKAILDAGAPPMEIHVLTPEEARVIQSLRMVRALAAKKAEM